MFLRPREVIRFLSTHAFLIPGMTVADLGCGGGYITVLLAAATGPAGRVWAVDIQAEAVRETKELAEVFGYRNIETKQASLIQLPFQSGSVDLVFLSQVLFQNQLAASAPTPSAGNTATLTAAHKKIEAIIAETSRIMAPAGHLVIVEPKVGQSFHHGQIVSSEAMVAAANKGGLVLVTERVFDDNYTLAVFAHG